jgi:hypothetical protein
MKKVVFIIGTGHCGSTLAELILASHPNVFGLGELKQPKWLANEHLCTICDDECPYWDRAVSRSMLRWHLNPPHNRLSLAFSTMLRRWKSIYSYLFDWFETDILIDSSKGHRWIKRQLAYSTPWTDIQPMLLHVVRDGRAVVNSYLRKYPERGAKVIIENWIEKIQQINRYYDEFLGPKYTVHYEDLASNPERTTQQLCNFLGIDYRPPMLAYWEHDHHTVGGNVGTRASIFRHRQRQSHGGERSADFYDQEPKIKLDLRWREELLSEHLAMFEAMTGELNAPFTYDVSQSPV